MSPAIKAGDTVLHKPSGEKWLVACVDISTIIACGWPETLARSSDCELIESCSQERHIETLRHVAGAPDDPKNGPRAYYAFDALIEMGDIEYIRAKRRKTEARLDTARRQVESCIAELKRLDDIVNAPQPPKDEVSA